MEDEEKINKNIENEVKKKNNNNYFFNLMEFIVSILISVGSFFINIFIQFTSGTCYTLPLNYKDISDGRRDFSILIVILLLIWSPLLFKKKYIKYLLLTLILLAPSLYFLFTYMPYNEKFHNGWCF